MDKDEIIMDAVDDIKGLQVLLFTLATDYSSHAPTIGMEKALFLLAKQAEEIASSLETVLSSEESELISLLEDAKK